MLSGYSSHVSGTPPDLTSRLPQQWVGLLDDAAVFPPGNAPLDEAVTAHRERRGEPWADLVGTLVVPDTDLPRLRGAGERLSVVLTGGAGQVSGPAGLARRLDLQVAGVEIALRDLGDLPGNARRVVAAVDDARSRGDLADDATVHVELPSTTPSHGWLAAADEIAGAELHLKFRLGGATADLTPTAAELAAMVDAALDRETPFKCTAGLHRAVAHTDPDGLPRHGFLNLLAATAAAWDGAGSEAVTALLASTDAAALAATPAEDLQRARRWFTSFGTCSIDEPRHDLRDLGLLED